MSGRNEELLSAYFDGELSDDEKSRVEQLLEEDVAAREALDDVAEVSGWIRSLPRSTAPAELRDTVLARVRTTATPLRALASVKRPAWRRHARWAAASAAGLLLALVAYQTWPVPNVTPQIASRSPVAGADPSLGLPASEGLVWDSREIGGSALAKSIRQDPEALARANTDQMLADLEHALESGTTPVPGEVVQNLSQVGDQVVVIQYRVVDTQDLPGRVQVLLTENGFKSFDDSRESEMLALDVNSNGTFEAIYLDAPTTSFYAAVEQITDLDEVTSVTTNTVSFVQPAESEERLSGADDKALFYQEDRSDGREGASVRSLELAPDAISDDVRNAPEPAPAAPPAPDPAVDRDSAAAILADQPTDAPAAGVPFEQLAELTAEQKKESETEPAWAAYQVPVPVPPELAERLQQNELLLERSEGADDGTDEYQRTKSRKQQKQSYRYWNFSKPTVQGPPPPPDRVRAVMLFVPQKSE